MVHTFMIQVCVCACSCYIPSTKKGFIPTEIEVCVCVRMCARSFTQDNRSWSADEVDQFKRPQSS